MKFSPLHLPTLADMPDPHNARVIVRAELDVPHKGGEILDDFRIKKALPTIMWLKERGAKIILISHIGRGAESLRTVAAHMEKDVGVNFLPTLAEHDVQKAVERMMSGDVLMLENLRTHAGEAANDDSFAKFFASLGDFYVNDAFAVSHRMHASIVGVPKFLPSYIGLEFEDEIKHLTFVLNPPHPFLFIIGGAKFQTKIPLIEKFVEIADTVFVGGALANNFFKVQGIEIGKSPIDAGEFHLADMLTSGKIVLPTDVIIMDAQGNRSEKTIDQISPTDAIWDCGKNTVAHLKNLVAQSSCVLWNGPLGDYLQGFDAGTKELLMAIAESNTTSIIGGGDTLSLVGELGLHGKFTFVSTGGGAMLDFLADGELPGIDAVVKSRKM